MSEDRSADEGHEEVESWQEAHRNLYEPKKRKKIPKRRKKKNKGPKQSPPPINAGKKKVPCPTCGVASLTRTIRDKKCMGCQAEAYLNSL